MNIRTVCASSVFLGREAFSTLGDVVIVPDRDITAKDLASADALITRSKTRVDEQLLRGSHVCFVGTATAGFDHFDTAYLNRAGIAWASAPGCNANSVRDYVVSAVLCLANRHHLQLEGKVIAVIGAGQVGSRVAAVAEALGIHVRLNDPPLQARSGKACYEPLDDVLKEADIVTLHVPLTEEGPFATRHMADCRFFSRLKPGCMFINASRGDVVNANALLEAMNGDVVTHSILDVWPGEPYLDTVLLNQVDVATPHIAGYSIEGKTAGTQALYRELCHFYEKEESWTLPALSAPTSSDIETDARGRSDEEVLWQIVRRVYDVGKDDAALRAGCVDDDAHAGAAHFVRLRMDYPVRRENSSARVVLVNAGESLLRKARSLGFDVISA